MSVFALSYARFLALAATLVGGMFLAAPMAQAQGMLAQVNNRAITQFDVAQRIRIAALTERRRIGNREALEELIDDQVKIIEATRIGYRVTEEGVDSEFAKLAKSNGASVRDFENVLRRSGLEPAAIRDRMKANIAWNALLRDRVKLGTQISNAEVESAMAEKSRTAARVVEYTLVPVVFIVPPGTSPGARVAAANAARGKFSGCENGFDGLRAMPDVYVRATTVRTSEDLSKPLLAVLEKTPVGKMTAPAAGEQGVESIAVCGKRDVKNAGAEKVAVADELTEKKVQSSSKTYLAELRKKVTIRYHR